MNNKTIYIGDLSKADAKILDGYRDLDILEFGVGASTQIFAQNKHKSIISIDTHQGWTDLVETFIDIEVDVLTKPDFCSYRELEGITEGSNQFDLIFDDGEASERERFALASWDSLKFGGKFLIHDTRRKAEQNLTSRMIAGFYPEIEKVEMNKNNSNISIITKRSPLTYDNWNVTESRAPWMYGLNAQRPKGWKVMVSSV